MSPYLFFRLSHFVFLIVFGAFAQSVLALDLEQLDDDVLSNVSGQQGIAMNYELRINSTSDGKPLGLSACPVVGGLTGGSSCRLAVSFADRPGIWAVMKEYRGIIKLDDIYIDASTLPAADNTSHRYLGNMSGYDPNGKPALMLSAGRWVMAGCVPGVAATESCNQYLNKAEYSDMTTAMRLDRLSAEFDDDVTDTPGYLLDKVPGAPISFRIAHGIGLVPDPNNPPDDMLGPYSDTPARVRFDGNLQIHGY